MNGDLWHYFPLVIGFLGTVGGWHVIWSAWSSRKWPTTKGSILSAGVNLAAGSTIPTTYHADIRYEYHVNGRRYESGKISYKTYGAIARNPAIRDLEKYGSASEVNVYYNPRNPKESVLDPGISWICFVPLPLALVIFVFGLFLLIRK